MDIYTVLPYFIPLGFLLMFHISYRLNRTSLLPGLMLSLCLLSFLRIAFVQAYASQNPAVKIFFTLAIGLFLLLAAFGAYIIVAFLIVNTAAMFRKETRSLSHLLGLVLATALLFAVITPRIVDTSGWPAAAVNLAYSAHGLMLYYALHLTQFIVSMILCGLSRPKKEIRTILSFSAAGSAAAESHLYSPVG